MSLIKENSLNKSAVINTSNTITISGITKGSVKSIGTIQSNLLLGDDLHTIPITFHVVQSDFPIPSDGIIGRDFIKSHACVLDFNKNLFTVRAGPDIYHIPIHNSTQSAQSSSKTQPQLNQSINSKRNKELLVTISSNLPSSECNSLLNLCQQYNDVFALNGDQHTVNNFYKQELILNDNTPVYIKNYRNPYSLKEEISKQIKDMLAKNIIEPSCSPFNSPIILVPKKSTADGVKKFRLCIDFRQLNKKLIPDKFPLPRVDEILDNLGRARYFSTLDLHAGFWQIPLTEQSKNLTSFSTEEGSYRFNVLPFGLNVAPNSFARMMKIAFNGLDASTAFLYLDDIIVIGTSKEHHLQNLERVFKICREKCLKLNPSKCHFMKSEVTFLGHKCTSQGILPDSSKFQSIKDYPVPTDKDSAKRFVLMANYWRKFIPNFSTIAAPLNHLDKKFVHFKWTPECQTSFELLKQSLIKPPILSYPDLTKSFIITVDASKQGVGAILSQLSDEGIDRPIAFASRAFTKGERNKATIEQELLAIHFGIKKFRPFIFGTKFLIRSDHKPLQYLFSLKDPTSRLARIRLDLTDYDFDIEHIKGKDNVAADALSRLSFDDIKDIRCDIDHQVLVMTRAQRKAVDNTTQEQQNQPPVRAMQPAKQVESAEEREELLNHFHSHPLEGGHIGQKKLYAKIRKNYKWQNMAKDVARLVKSCVLCQTNKPKFQNKEPLIITETPKRPFHTIVIDTIGPFPTTTNKSKYALTVICDFSKFLIAVPVPNKEAKTIARALVDHCLLLHGPVQVIKSDLGTEYANCLMKSLAQSLHIEHRTSTAYHHETLGSVERSHRTLNEYLRNYLSEGMNWEKLIRYFNFCYNTTPNRAIDMYTPFELVFGRQPSQLLFKEEGKEVKDVDVSQFVKKLKEDLQSAYERARGCLHRQKLLTKMNYDAKYARPLNVQVGDEVLLVNEVRNKKDPYYRIGYKVTEIHDNGNVCIIDEEGTSSLVHKNRLRKP